MKIFLLILGVIVLIAACLFISASVFEFLWNYSLVPLFHAPVLNIWYSLAITALLGFFIPRHSNS